MSHPRSHCNMCDVWIAWQCEWIRVHNNPLGSEEGCGMYSTQSSACYQFPTCMLEQFFNMSVQRLPHFGCVWFFRHMPRCTDSKHLGLCTTQAGTLQGLAKSIKMYGAFAERGSFCTLDNVRLVCSNPLVASCCFAFHFNPYHDCISL